MERKTKRNLLKGTMVAGALLSVTALSATPNSSNLFEYTSLGSGAEVRTEILHSNSNPLNTFEAKCGEETGKKAEKATKKSAAKEGKSKEAKCGEASCGEGDKKADAKKASAKKTTEKKSEAESKSKEQKCGEGKCGE